MITKLTAGASRSTRPGPASREVVAAATGVVVATGEADGGMAGEAGDAGDRATRRPAAGRRSGHPDFCVRPASAERGASWSILRLPRASHHVEVAEPAGVIADFSPNARQAACEGNAIVGRGAAERPLQTESGRRR